MLPGEAAAAGKAQHDLDLRELWHSFNVKAARQAVFDGASSTSGRSVRMLRMHI